MLQGDLHGNNMFDFTGSTDKNMKLVHGSFFKRFILFFWCRSIGIVVYSETNSTTKEGFSYDTKECKKYI